ncbi:putative secreted protein with PEP-CTERM sorting signal [Roseiarcus fermentans]|uniref:Putative secreted protein with PEP-CTERM sorting signal n=1 Tax=Roseiarcus fermentans TaxID=1473586 RepID=A0A366FBH0_9HYPH|nr:spherulation-specific family 4 protein [Roseiarcus fermentans]RBP11981.1 putative secreted protein with PEP-CTERM sorting signal [Roseiarcus fermentans]
MDARRSTRGFRSGILADTENRRPIRPRRLAAIAAAAIAACVPAAARAETLSLLVPAYFAPGAGGTEGYTDGWAQLAASAGKVPITAILSPNSGPDSGAVPIYTVAVANLERAGGRVVGYVNTHDGALPLADAEAQVTAYLSQYPGAIDGFLIDNMSSHYSGLSYYQALYAFVKSLGAYQVIGNPGGDTHRAYLTAADTLVTFEGAAAAYPAATPPSWVAAQPASSFVNTISDQFSVSGMAADIALARERNAGYVYVTDQSMYSTDSFLYDRMPSYWNAEVATVAASGAAVPEPGAVVLTALGMVAMAGAMAQSRRRGQTARANGGAPRSVERIGAG